MNREKTFAEKCFAYYIFCVTSDHPDFDLVEGFLAGDKGAYALIEASIEAAYRGWQKRFGSEADDIKSDIRYKLLISLQRGDFEFRSRLKTYINRIVNRTCIDYLRFNIRYTSEEVENLKLPADTLSPEDRLESRQEIKIAYRVLRLAPPECQELWRMYLKDNMKYREIGEKLGKTEGNIKRRLWACRETAKKIREKLLKKDKLL